jgi:hypothetical protein
MKHTMIWALLLAGAFVATAGVAAAQDDNGDNDFAIRSCGATLGEGGSLTALGDIDESEDRTVERDQEVDVDEDDILLGIALANNGASDITWNKLRDYDATESREHTITRTADYDRDDVFSALALGLDADAGALDALACVSDVDMTVTQEREVSQEVDLEEDDVLLAIALSNSVGGDLVFDDIADMSQSERVSMERTQDVDVDREDTFLALALGAGGSGNA